MSKIKWLIGTVFTFITFNYFYIANDGGLIFVPEKSFSGKLVRLTVGKRKCYVDHANAYTVLEDGRRFPSPRECEAGSAEAYCRQYLNGRIWVYD